MRITLRVQLKQNFTFRQFILTHKQGILDQLYKCNDPSLVLHLACLVIFTIVTGNMLHASGKFVSSILEFLAAGFLTDEENMQLLKFHELVLMLFKADSEEVKTDVTGKLDDLIPKVKDMAANFKKISKNKEGAEAEEWNGKFGWRIKTFASVKLTSPRMSLITPTRDSNLLNTFRSLINVSS